MEYTKLSYEERKKVARHVLSMINHVIESLEADLGTTIYPVDRIQIDQDHFDTMNL